MPEGLDSSLPVARPAGGPLVETETINLSTSESRAVLIWLDRPHQLNALNRELILQLESSLHAADEDEGVRAIFITGRGRAFSAGGDLLSYLTLQKDGRAFAAFIDDVHRAFGGIRLMRKPVVALVNGIAAAGGLELLLACDFAVAGESARIGDAHLNYGQIGGGGSLALLPHAVGVARARELVFSGRLLTAQESLDWGLITRVVSDDQLLDFATEFGEAVATKSAEGVAAAKYVMNASFAAGVGLDSALRLERERTLVYCLTMPDSMEGLTAFAEKRKPRYKSR